MNRVWWYLPYSTVRARLLVLTTLIVIPAVVFLAILASTSYRSVRSGIESSQVEMASSYAARVTIWFRGGLRMLVSVVAGLDTLAASDRQCAVVANRIVSDVVGVRGITVLLEGGVGCHSRDGNMVSPETMAAVLATQRNLAPSAPWVGKPAAESRFDTAEIGETRYIVIYARSLVDAPQYWEALLLLDPSLLNQVFEPGPSGGKDFIALMTEAGGLVAGRDQASEAAGWLPATELPLGDGWRWRVQGRDGAMATYVGKRVTSSGFYLLARFDDEPERAAKIQFAVLLIGPVAIFAILLAVYARYIQRDVARWIAGIEEAAKAPKSDLSTPVFAPIDPRMPSDIRSVAGAFNDMVLSANRRETTLHQSLEENRHLMRELHHRVKNSLQVIQSYLAFLRRQQPVAKGGHLAEIEAKVQVMSTAYRLALSDSGIQPVQVGQFAEEILRNLSTSAQRDARELIWRVDPMAVSLPIDRIIPLGLALSEAVIQALKAETANRVEVSIRALEPGAQELRVATDGVVAINAPTMRMLAGFAGQLEAEQMANEAGEVIRWRFTL